MYNLKELSKRMCEELEEIDRDYDMKYRPTVRACSLILESWERKNPIIDFLGGLSKTITLEVDMKEDDLTKLREDFVEEALKLKNKNKKLLNRLILLTITNNQFRKNKIKPKEIRGLIQAVDDYILCEEMKDIKEIGKIKEAIIPNLNRFKSGGKLSKLLSLLLGDEISQLYSLSLSKMGKEKAEIHLSVDPIDFLNMSHGNSWTSCYRLRDAGDEGEMGCYSAGTISYMMDAHTMIAWTGDCQRKKEWRQCIYVDIENEVFVGSRQYPVEKDESFSRALREYIQGEFEKRNHNNEEQTWTISRKHSFIGDNVIYEGSDYIYSDIHNGHQSCYVSFLGDKKDIESFEIGESPRCVSCGSFLNDESEITCEDCSGFETCDCCGCGSNECETIEVENYQELTLCPDCLKKYHKCEYEDIYFPEDEMIFIQDYGWVANENLGRIDDIFYCDNCENWFYKEETEDIELKTNCEENIYICEHCYFSEDKYKECKNCGEVFEKKDEDLYKDVFICYDCQKEQKNEEDTEEIND